jgi:hypothetical protein
VYERRLQLEFTILLDELDARVDEPVEQVAYDFEMIFGHVPRQRVFNVRVLERFPAKL